jgi:hypothetical protein
VKQIDDVIDQLCEMGIDLVEPEEIEESRSTATGRRGPKTTRSRLGPCMRAFLRAIGMGVVGELLTEGPVSQRTGCQCPRHR